MKWVLALLVLGVGGVGAYFGFTEERPLFECTACLVTDPQTCALASAYPDPGLHDDLAARQAAVESLCTSMGVADVAACARSPKGRIRTGCTSQVRRVLKPMPWAR